MEDLNTVDYIIDWLKDKAERRDVLGPSEWLRCALAINVLLQGEEDKLFEIEHGLANKKQEALTSGSNGVEARAIIEASNEYLQARKLKAKIDRAKEIIRLAKKYANMEGELLKS